MDNRHLRDLVRRTLADEWPENQRGDAYEGPAQRPATPSRNGHAPRGNPVPGEVERTPDRDGPALVRPLSMADLVQRYPTMRPPVIDGLLRVGETMNLIAAPKTGKSWLVSSLAFAVAMGRPWLGFDTSQGRVLIVDNELHPETLAGRLRRVAGDELAALGGRIDVLSLRGQLHDLIHLGAILRDCESGNYKVVVIDAFYRTLPAGLDENSNADIAGLYNAIDTVADHLQAGFVLIHHASKGNQSAKSVTDVGSGAGSQSRAADSHLILRPHENENALVVEAVVRSFPPVEPRCLRREFPAFTLAPDLDPADLREAKPRRRAKTDAEPAAPPKPVDPPWTAQRFADAFGTDEPQARSIILENARALGLPESRAKSLLQLAIDQKMLFSWPEKGANSKRLVSRTPQSTESP